MIKNIQRRKYYVRATTASLLLCLPTFLVLSGLVFKDHIMFSDASTALAIAAAGTIFLVFRHYKKIADARDYIEQVAKTRELGHKLPKRPASMKEMVEAIQELNYAWEETNGQLRAFVGALENILESIPDPLLMLDENRRIVRANISARTLLGTNIQNRDLASIIKDPWLLEATNVALSSGASRTIEFSMTTADAREFRVRLEPLLTTTPDRAKVILTLHDISALRRTERTMADFVANASHELKTPLSVILGFIETLRGPAKDDTKARDKFLTTMHEQAERMSKLVLDLLSLSSVELNEHTIPQDHVKLSPLIRNVFDTLELKAEQLNVDLNLSIPGDLPMIIGDKDQLTQVFQNLIDNALKYGAEGKQVSVAAKIADAPPAGFPSWDGDIICVSITDFGPGIPPEAIPRLTERFFRVDREQKVSGTGLGLAIVKHIINRHRGLLTIESAVGKGSTFSVYLRGITESSDNLTSAA